MGIDYRILIGCSDSTLYHDLTNMEYIKSWVKTRRPYAEFQQLSGEYGTQLFLCDYYKNLNSEEEDFLKYLRSFDWSDDFFVMISQNGDPWVHKEDNYNVWKGRDSL